MFDFRYHAISVAGVIVALVIGLLLGVAIGDKNLVSSASRELSRDLVKKARAQNATLSARADSLSSELAQRDRYEKATLPTLVNGELPGRKVAVLFLHDGARTGLTSISGAIIAAGGELAWEATLRLPVDPGALAASVPEGLRYTGLGTDPALLGPFAERVGRQLVAGGRLAGSVRRQLLSSFSGTLGGIGAIVVVRRDPGDQDAQVRAGEDRFVTALLRGMRSFDTPAVGVEQTDTDPSQVRWYRTHGLSSVDDVDLPAGQAALVFALAGQADGAYGIKGTADTLLPEALTRPAG